MYTMNFEQLANELLLDIFEYLSAVDILRAFNQLNTRFDTLLLTHSKTYHLHFRSVSKHDFRFFCQRNLPLIANQIISLTLSDDIETPNSINSFLSYGITFSQMNSLRSIKIHHLRSSMVMHRLLIECHHFPHLTRLDFTDCSFKTESQSISNQLNNLWKLPELISCHMDIDFHSEGSYTIHPSTISTSLRSLSIESYCYSCNDLNNLLRHTPSLQYLHILLRDDPDDDLSLTFPTTSLVTVKLSAYMSPLTLTTILKHIPKLRCLTVTTDEVNMNGHNWEEIIVKYLPQLKQFHLKMIFRLEDYDNKEQRVDDLLNSFGTQFWLREHQWFVRCDWNCCEQCDKNNIYLYTLPYAFDFYSVHRANIKSKSTRHVDNDDSSYDNVRTIGYEIIPTCDRISPVFRFKNLHHLDVHLPFDENLILIAPELDQLISLQVSTHRLDYEFDAQKQLQALFNRAPHLTSLIF
ncbi:unnamed protein product, partial [Adineta ricciae]